MSRVVDAARLVWPDARIGDALVALARHSGLVTAPASASRHAPVDDLPSLDRWLAALGEQIGITVESVTASHGDTDAALLALHPAMIRLGGGVLVVVGQRRDYLLCLDPEGAVRKASRHAVCRALQESHEPEHRDRISKLLSHTQLSPQARAKAQAGILKEFLTTTKVMHAWRIQLPAGAPFLRQIRAAGMLKVAATLTIAHVAQYLLYLLSWAAVGRAILGGRFASGWMWGWALMLLATVPLLMLATWSQGRLAVGMGTLLRKRLLAGALALPPEAINRDGVGRLLGRAIEADALERLSLGGGFTSALGLLEVVLVVPVLVAGAGGWPHALLFLGWVVVMLVLALRLGRARKDWTDQRLQVTGLMVERIVGHRTRIAQELPERWHDGEDDALSGYYDRSEGLDRRQLALQAIIPRGWLLIGLAALAPAFIDGAEPGAMGIAVGGVVLSWTSLSKLGNGFDQLASAYVAWRRVAMLFHAAAGRLPPRDGRPAPPPRKPSAPEYVIAPPPKPNQAVLEAVDVTFRHSGRTTNVLSGCDLVIRNGDRILLQGPSGGGKSTLVSLLSGIQQPKSGLMLARGLDMSCLGDTGWRARISVAPQFHENHVLTETFAFNLLMGRAWPPRREDLDEARALCAELGLGPLLERMPGGLFETVGETGWQLSHGEKSRMFIARALLQQSDVVILDESLAALDPENMATTLKCLRNRARSLVVIAHP